MQKALILIAVIFAFLLIFCPACFVNAQSASLYLSPGSGTFFVGSTFDVSIFVNTGGTNINTVKVDLKFDPKKIQIASPATGKSFISVWISQPSYSNIEGTISFQGGTPSPGINTSAGLVSTITFRATAPGETSIFILNSSQVLLDDGKGTNILSSIAKGDYLITIPPPEGPQVFSSTHPDQNEWSKNNNPSLSWEKEEGVNGFSYSIDNNFHGVPDNISEGDQTSVSYADLEDGIWCFHVKAKKGDSWGGVSHYLVQIDTMPPAEFQLRFEPALRSPVMTSKEPLVYFVTTDVLAGINHYELKVINLNQNLEREKTGFFVEVTNPYKLFSLEGGEYEIVVRVYDEALNSRDVSEKIEVIPIDKIFYITKRGVSIWNFFFYWNRVVLILSVFIILMAIIIFFWRKRHKKIALKIESLKNLEEKVKKDSQEIKKKLYEQ